MDRVKRLAAQFLPGGSGSKVSTIWCFVLVAHVPFAAKRDMYDNQASVGVCELPASRLTVILFHTSAC